MANTENAATGAKREGKILQIVLSLIIFAGFVALLFVPDTAGHDAALWSLVLDLFKGQFAGPTLTKAALGVFVGAYAVLLACTVAAFFTRRPAALGLNFCKAFVCALAAAFFIFALKQGGLSFSDILLSDSTFVALNSTTIMAAWGVLSVIVLSFTAYKGFAVVKLIFAVLAGGYLAFATRVFAGDANFGALLYGVELGEGTVAGVAEIVFRVLAWSVLANILLAAFTLMLPRTGVLDVIRAVYMFLLAVVAAVLLGLIDSFGNLFSTQYLGTLGAVGVSLVQLIYAIVVAVVLHVKKARRQEAQEEAEDAAEEPVFPYGVFNSDNQMMFTGAAAPAAEPAAEPAAPVAEPAPEPAPSAEAATANKAFEEAAQISIDDLGAAPENDYDSIIRDQPAQESAEEEKPFDFDQVKHDGTFNRDYADYEQRQSAQEEAPAYGYAQQTPPQTPPPYAQTYAQHQPYGQPYAPQAPQQPYPQQPYAAPDYYGASGGYVPDAFINGLTPAERDEFTRLFISRVYGENRRLPVYRVGEDNREFFTKIFVFMGRYRNIISDGLLEKIYNYSNLVR